MDLRMRVLVPLRPSPDVGAPCADPAVTATAADVVNGLPGVLLDPTFTPVAVPRPRPARAGGDPLSLNQPLIFSMAPGDASVLVRGEIADDELSTRLALLP